MCKYLFKLLIPDSLGQLARSGIATVYGNSMFNLLSSFLSVFHDSCVILCSHQQYTEVTVPPHPHQPVSLFNFCHSGGFMEEYLMVLSILSHAYWISEYYFIKCYSRFCVVLLVCLFLNDLFLFKHMYCRYLFLCVT